MNYLKFLLLFLIVCSSSFAQENDLEVYIDEENKEIDIITFLKKTASFLYTSKKVVKENLTINLLIENYKIGKLDSIENIQIRGYLSKKLENNLIKKNTLIISFKDTVFGYNQTIVRNNKLYKKHNHEIHKLSKSEYLDYRVQFDVNQKRGIKKLLKKDIVPLYFYGFNKEYTYQAKNYKLNKLPHPLSKIMINGYSKIFILKPNGEYFMYNNIPPNNFVFKLLKDDWSEYKKDYQKAKSLLLKEKMVPFKTLFLIEEGKIKLFIFKISLRLGALILVGV